VPGNPVALSRPGMGTRRARRTAPGAGPGRTVRCACPVPIGRLVTHGTATSHGLTHDGSENEIVVGGGADDLKAHVAAVLVRAVAGTPLTVRIAAPGDPLGGAEARNIVNRITAGRRGGVQIEQGPLARDHYPLVIADAVAHAYRARLGRRGAGRPEAG
jgi:Poly-gamma-glutamate hydrolase